ncbi:hypothetical protein QO010_001855 [Caulobacter ginsengisoli]|uniref:HAD family hydrolase n=1 Tax=Caulobacter ginsengisoli TaxID=400775 RepID=A0ABU0ISS8_9CAUL|nr:hypothetical protein [Caulobacter ginsengisoli]MDQ0464084.1 hypothetical protein [Caulobacter ginsengisoli]
MSLSLPQDLIVSPSAPLLIVDVDEVLALFMAGFERFIRRQGYEMRIDRFALFQNLYRPGEAEHLDIVTGRALFDAFFRDGADDLEPVAGAADALADLSQRAGVVILTNAPDCGRESRTGWLARHGFDFPMILNSGVKGPIIAQLAGLTSGPVAFIDDLLPNLESAAESAPRVLRFQTVADPRLRPLAPQAPERHPRHDDWADLKPAIEAAVWR